MKSPEPFSWRGKNPSKNVNDWSRYQVVETMGRFDVEMQPTDSGSRLPGVPSQGSLLRLKPVGPGPHQARGSRTCAGLISTLLTRT